MMTIRSERPELFEVEPEERNCKDMDVRKISSTVHDSVKYYLQVKKDAKLSRQTVEYEKLGVNTFLAKLEIAKKKILEVYGKPQEIKNILYYRAHTSEVSDHCDSLSSSLTTRKPLLELKSCLQDLKSSCRNTLTFIESLNIPHVRPYVCQLTDAGPGVGVNNFEAQFRDTEIASLFKSRLRHRSHLATDDQLRSQYRLKVKCLCGGGHSRWVSPEN